MVRISDVIKNDGKPPESVGAGVAVSIVLRGRSVCVCLIQGRINKGWEAAFREAAFAHVSVQIVNPCLVTCLEKTCIPTLWARNCNTGEPVNLAHSNSPPWHARGR